MDGKPVAPIKKIMECVPNHITVSAEEISKIAKYSGKYKLHPNGAVLMRAKN
jgi:effector-binding domain-containing protein